MPTRKAPPRTPRRRAAEARPQRRPSEPDTEGEAQGPAEDGAEERKTEHSTERRAEPAASGDSLNAYMRAIGDYHPLTLEDEQALGRRIRDGDEEALRRLVEANLRFVVSYAKRYRNMGLSFIDLIHEGNLGLMEAAKRFDPERNVKFISYAVWWVRQAIFHALSEHSRIFRLPQKLSGQVSRIGKARDELQAEEKGMPSSEDIAKRVNMSVEEVEALMQVAGDDLSLSTAVGDDGNLELGDTLEQETIPSVELELMQSSFSERIQAMVGQLDDKEQSVIRMRFGFDGDEPRTLQEIGEALGLSRERIRQIESKAKEKLRRNQAVQGLRTSLN